MRKLRQADGLLSGGKSVAEVAGVLEVSENTYHRWRHQYGDDVASKELIQRHLHNIARDIRGVQWP